MLRVSIAFMIAFAVTAKIMVAMVTGTDAGSVLINNVWLIVLAGVGLYALVKNGFGD